MRVVILFALFGCVAPTTIFAEEQTLGDRRLFFTEQERIAAVDVGNLSRERESPQSTEQAIKENEEISIQPSISQRHPELVVNGFIKSSGLLTLIINGLPCDAILTDEASLPRLNCRHLKKFLSKKLSLHRDHKRKLTLKVAGNDNFEVIW